MTPPEAAGPSALEDRWDAYLLRRIAASDAQELLSALERDARECAARRRDAAMHLSLSYLYGPPHASARLIRSVEARIEGLAAGESSGRFQQRVMAELEAAPARAIRMRRTARPARATFSIAASAALFALVAAGFVLGWFSREKSPSGRQVQAPVAPPEPARPAWRARVACVAGTIEVDTRRVLPSAPLEVAAGAVVTAGAEARARLELADGSVVEIDEGSRLAVHELQQYTGLALERGSLNARVQPQKGGSVRVGTPHLEVRVVGTEFRVDAGARESGVLVQHGRVEVSPRDAGAGAAPPVLVEAGQEVSGNARGVGERVLTRMKRGLGLELSRQEDFADPILLEKTVGRTYRGLPLQTLEYRPPAEHAMGYAGLRWPLQLAEGEDRFELYFRIVGGSNEPGESKRLLGFLLGQEESDYAMGQVHVSVQDPSWVRLQGKWEHARWNWSRPDAPVPPLQRERVKYIMFRVLSGGAVRLEHTEVRVWKSKE